MVKGHFYMPYILLLCQKACRRIGLSAFMTLFALFAISTGALAAEFEAIPDRTKLAENETLILYLRTDNIRQRNEPDLSVLETNFEILSTQVRSNIQIINGQNQSEKLWQVTLLPKRSGIIEVPAISLDNLSSQPFTLTISDAPADEQQSADVFLDSSIDQKDSIYVQQQLIYTLRLYYATTISDHGLTEPELPDTLMVQLDNRQDFESRVNGRLYNVAQWQFAIFPQKSGELVIPAQTFSGRIRISNNYSLGALKQIRTKSPEHRITVKPIPDNFPAGFTWLPAESMEITEQWSGDFSQWQSGSPLTRTIALSARGLTAAQLPPVNLSLPDYIRQYPEQPQLKDTPTAEGMLGEKQINVALIPTKSGLMVLPDIRLPWWNTVTDQLEYVSLASLKLDIAADPELAQTPAVIAPVESDEKQIVYIEKDNIIWQISTGASSFLSLILLWLWWNTRQKLAGAQQQKPALTTTESIDKETSHVKKQLIQACRDNDAHTAWRSWQQWQKLSEVVPDNATHQALQQLQSCLYGPAAVPEQWQGKVLAEAIGQLQNSSPAQSEQPLASLYPE